MDPRTEESLRIQAKVYDIQNEVGFGHEPDWSLAPDWVNAHAFAPIGTGVWMSQSNVVIATHAAPNGWRIEDGEHLSTIPGYMYSPYRLKLGEDWRLSLKVKP